MQRFTFGDGPRRKPPDMLVILFSPKHEIQIPLAPSIEVLEVALRVRLVDAGHGLVDLVAHADLHELRRIVPLLRLLHPKRRAKRPTLASAFLDVEAHLERRTLLEVKVVRERVVQRTVDASLVGVEGTFEGRLRACQER